MIHSDAKQNRQLLIMCYNNYTCSFIHLIKVNLHQPDFGNRL